MGRTESIVIQVHPSDEQAQINLMERFHWNLLNSQEIKTIDNHLERRGDTIYQVTNSEHYVKLAFSRELDLPNLQEIRQLEQQFFGLVDPDFPALFPISFWVWLIASFVWGIGIVAWILYYFLSYKPKQAAAEQVAAENQRKRQQILAAVERYA